MGRIVQETGFRPAWWLRNPHLQTLWPTRFRARPDLRLTRERVELADGDFIDLSWTEDNGGPVVLLLHGLEGSLESHYSRATLSALRSTGLHAAFMHLRGCSGEPNRLARSYHSGASEDLAEVIEHIRRTRSRAPAGAVGISIGGNLLLKYLGELGREAPLNAAVAVSVPFRLLDCAQRLDLGPSRLYREHLMRQLRASYRRKFDTRPAPLAVELNRLRGFYEYDDKVTAPLNGFDGADDYYARCSCRGYLAKIETPTLIIHARDDPFMFPDTIPGESELGPGVSLELTHLGGHVGFVQGGFPGRVSYWTDQRIPSFFKQRLAVNRSSC